MIQATCPECDQVLRVPDEMIGQGRHCLACGHLFTVRPTAQRQAPSEPPAYALLPAEGQDDRPPVPARESELRSSATGHPRPRAKKRMKPDRPAPRWGLLLLVGAVGAAGCVLLAGVLWFFWRGKAASPDKRPAAAAREPQAGGPTSWVPPVALASADPAAWKVTADEAAPPAGLRSAFPFPPGQFEALAFAAPAGQAGVVMHTPQGVGASACTWVRYDLRRIEPIGQVLLSDAKTPSAEALRGRHPRIPEVCALSPSGDRIAVRDGHNRFVGVWSKEGRRVAILRAGGAGVSWVGFAGEDRLWVLTGKQLRLREVPTDKTLATVPGEVLAPPALTPRGTWLVAYTGRELVFLKGSDGSRAGSIPLPDGWGDAKGSPHPVIDPSGRAVAIVLSNARSDVLVGVWDLASGRLTDSFVLTYHVSQCRLGDALQWLGGRRLFCNRTVVDLDLRAMVSTHDGEVNVVGPLTPTPDGRIWLVRTFTDPEWAKVGKKIARQAGAPATRTFLTAASLPEALAGSLDAARDGFRWHPGVAVRVVAADTVPKRHRAGLVEVCADKLAKEGYRIDPDASYTVEAVAKIGGKRQGIGKEVPREQLPESLKGRPLPPGKAWHEITDIYELGVQGRVFDAKGRLALQTRGFMEHRVVKKGDGEDKVWESVAERGLDLRLPRVYLRDADHKRRLLPKSFRLGVDGLFEGKVEMHPGGIKDGFELPEDG